MKKTNKGFSLVELIIVIAIMAILAGALAPALIKYINKSRLSTDVQTAQTIASAIQAALANEDAYDDAAGRTITNSPAATLNVGAHFNSEFESAVGGNKGKLYVKSKKDMDGTPFTTDDFLVSIDAINNTCSVYVGDTNHEAYPNPVKSLSQKN